MRTGFSRAALIAVLSAVPAMNARAETLNAARDRIVTGIVVVTAAVAVGVALLILHEKHKQSRITGRVSAGATGMDVTDESNKRIYSRPAIP